MGKPRTLASNLPPWSSHDKREHEEMVQWAHSKLDDLQLAEFHRNANDKGHKNKFLAWLEAYGPEIEAADRGNIAPLQKRLPMLARFLVAPPMQKRTKQQKQDAVAAAVWAVHNLRTIWQKEYGRRNRRNQDGPSAQEIAASWAGVTISDVEKGLKPSGPSGKKRKLSRAE
jgi:hypothetical protein